MYLCDSIASLKILCITTGDFEVSLFHSNIQMKQACTNAKGVSNTENLDSFRWCSYDGTTNKKLQTYFGRNTFADYAKEYAFNF